MTLARLWAQGILQKIRRRRLPLVPAALLFAGGIALGDAVHLPAAGLAGLAGAALALTWINPARGIYWAGIFLTGMALQSLVRESIPAAPKEPHPAEIQGWVAEPPAPFGATGEKFRVITQTGREKMLVIWKGRPAPEYGDEVRVSGVRRAIAAPRNPGEFDFADWMRRRGIVAELEPLSAGECRIVGAGHGNPLVRLALRSRQWMLRTIVEGLDPADPAAALIQAMTLGDTDGVPDSVREDFQLSGTLHVFSVSGLHVAMVAVIFWQIFRLFRLPRLVQAGLVIGVVFFYALVTGWNPPGVRAAIMTACFIAATLAGRRPQPFNILAGAALILLLLHPPELFNAGFQLSFTVVAAILAFARAWQIGLQRFLAPDPWLPRPLYSRQQEWQWLAARHFGSLLAVSLAASLGSLLLTGLHFHFVSVISPWINLLVVPLSFLILSLSVISLLTGWSAWLAGAFAQANWLAANLTLICVQHAADLPGSAFPVGPPLPPATLARVTVFDAGRGAAVVIQCPGQTVLLDTGSAFVFERSVLPYLRGQGIARVTGIFLSHGDAQHVGGAGPAVRELRPQWIGVSSLRSRSPALREVFRETGRPRRLWFPGDRLRLGRDVVLEILAPLSDETPLADDGTLMFRLSAGPNRLLFTFDSGYRVEDQLLANDPGVLAAEVWIKGQHASGLSGRDSFLEAVSPLVILATHADFPESERLAPARRRDWEGRGIRVLDQGETGAVRIECRPDRLIFQPFLRGDPLEIRP